MNNKSTENLVESDGSIEELFVPPLDLKAPEVSKTSTGIDQDDKPKSVRNNFLVGKSVAPNPPVPAIRKHSLPPIASKRNGKDLKENNNQKVRKQLHEDSIPIIEELSVHSESRSDSEKREATPPVQPRRNKIELASFSKKTKKRKQFVSAEANEETTSFISYEEKHEKEDNSEHFISNHSSVKSRDSSNEGSGGRVNAAFVEDPGDIGQMKDENRNRENQEDDTTTRHKTKSRNKERNFDKNGEKNNEKNGEKRPKSKKIKEKRTKRSSRKSAQSGEEIELAERHHSQETYDFKKLIGICLHETSALPFDPLIRQPRVRVSFYDLTNSKLLSKSNPLRNAVLNYEPTNVTFIQPILSDSCKFKDSCEIECDWDDEVLIINEDIRYIQKTNVIIFFEIVDIQITRHSAGSSGWYPICWAFLKPGDGKSFSNIDVRCSLQLYRYQNQKLKDGIIDEWKAQKRIKFPAYLSVTVASYRPEATRSVSLTRPMSVLEEEVTGDIYTCASDVDELSDQACQPSNSMPALKHHDASRSESKQFNLETRLPGQECVCPNRIVYRHELAGNFRSSASHSQYGSMVSKFSVNGTMLAFHSTTYTRSNHEIIILRVKNLEVCHVLIGHLNIVYDLDWLNEDTLVSVSSDRTAIVWFLAECNYTMKILPHSSFVYAVKWLSKSSVDAYIATGGRDCVLRIWKINLDSSADIELCDELIQHDNYITSLAVTRTSTKLYTADWSGVLLEWSRKKSREKTKEPDAGQLYHLRRKIKIFPTSITRIELHAKSNRLYVQCIGDALIYAIETTSAIVIQTIKCTDEDYHPLEIRNVFTVSPCGSLIFTKSPNEDQIKCIRVSNEEPSGHIRIPVSLMTRKYAVTSLCYHPNKNLIACSIFGGTINSCLFLMCNQAENVTKDVDTLQDDGLQQKIDSLDHWNNIRSLEMPIAEDTKPIAFESILNRIDDLFRMAIRSPLTGTNYEFEEMQMVLQKLRLESPQFTDDTKRDAIRTNDSSSVSNKSNRSTKRATSWLLQNTALHSSNSDDSKSARHNYERDHDATNVQTIDEKELSNATYSIQSDQSSRSNATFNVHK